MSELLSALSDAVSSQVSHGRPDETTVNPSGQHGHQGNNDVFVLNEDNLKFELFRSSHGSTFIYGEDDFAAYYGGGEQTIYDFGAGAHLHFSEITAPIKVYGLEHDSKAIIDLLMRHPGRNCRRMGMVARCSPTLTL